MPEYRSFSQLDQYGRCPHAYELARLQRVWKKPAAWLPMGTAVHYAAEMWEKSQRKAVRAVVRAWFKEKYAEEVNHYLEQTPNMRYWQHSGPYDGEADIARRYKVGLEHVDRYLGWYGKHPEEVIWITPDGTPAIELPFDFELGGVQIKGMLDQAIAMPDGTVLARDIKTGNKPGVVEQLSIAGHAITQADPTVTPALGDFLMTKSGYPTYPYDLVDVDVLTEQFMTLDANIRAGHFPAKPEPAKCDRCDVANSCTFKA